MAEKTFDLKFDGYKLEENKLGLPEYSGVYVVHSCIYNKKEDTVSLMRLLYIGKAGNINDRVNNHEKLENWKKELKEEEQLCYNYTKVNTAYNNRVEAALINANQPIVNVDYKESFPFDSTIINCSNRYNLLKENIKVTKH